ncbi:unannotated protein [freshwater metagenome]|uniref:Unannotated protein n=1 Tax=freshwater metagenome TaxID=449393 RepID=A0A6J6K4B2_9ZZZZ
MLDQRGRRIRTIAASMEDDNLRAMLADSQIKGSQYLVDSYEMAKQQGLIKPKIEIETIVYLTQAMFIGRVLVDITEREDLSDSINEAIVLVLRTLMNPQK